MDTFFRRFKKTTMKKTNFQNCKMSGRNNSSKTSKIAMYLLFSIFTCIFLNIHAQEICKGNSVDLVPPNPTGTIVEWKDPSGNTLTRLDEKGIRITDLTPKVTPLVTTTYTVKQVDAVNLIANGNFDPPPTYPQNLSEYNYIAPTKKTFTHEYNIGYFTINVNPQLLFDSTQYSPTNPDLGFRANWYRSIGDHTTGHGNMFIANGAGGTVVYTNTVNVTAGTVYYVGAWFANINANFTNPYNMDIYVNGGYIGNISGAYNDNWYQKYAFWTATITGQVTLVFKNNQHASDGNDFAIDDIVFSPVVESTVTVKVKNPTSAPILNKTICQGDSVVFYGNAYKTSGTYNAHLTNSVGCDSLATLILKVGLSSAAPVLNKTICHGDSVLFYGSSYKTSGTYNAHLNNSVGCDSLATLVLTVNPALSTKISGESFICIDSIAPNIVFKGENGIAPYTFTYQINGGVTKSITTALGDTVSIKVPTSISGVFTYKLINVVDTKGCEYVQNDSLVLHIEGCKIVINIPNAFTPNGDGFNDTFGPTTEGIKEIKMNINARNGRLVFSIDSINGRWDGLMQTGEQAPVGVYFYKYNAKGIGNKSYTDQGSVSLFREMINPAPISITPNPVKGNAVVDLSRMKGLKNISIYNTFGRVINSWVTSEDISRFDSSLLKNGLYILKVSFANQVVFVKFIKE